MTTNPVPDKMASSKTRRKPWTPPGYLEISEAPPRKDETPQDIPPGGNIPKPPKRTGGNEEGRSDDGSQKPITPEEIIEALANLPTWNDWIADAYRWLLDNYQLPNE